MGTKSLLTTVQTICGEVGLPQPLTVVGTTTMQVRQLVAFVNATGDALRDEYEWPFLRKLATITTVTSTAGYTVAQAPYTCNAIIAETGWDATNHWYFLGSISDADWAWWQYSLNSTPIRRIWRTTADNAIEVFPVPTADGDTLQLSFSAVEWALNGSTPAASMANDADTHVFNDRLVIAGAKYRYLQQKGLPFDTPKAEYDRLLPIRKSKSRPGMTLSLDPRANGRIPFLTYANVPDSGYGP